MVAVKLHRKGYLKDGTLLLGDVYHLIVYDHNLHERGVVKFKYPV